MNERLRVRLVQARERFDAWFDAYGDLRGPCLFRVFAGPLTVVHLWPFCTRLLRGDFFRDSFYVRWWDRYPEVPRPLYGALLLLGMLSAAAMSVGLLSRWSTRVTFAVVAYNFFSSETFFHHNRAFLLIFLCGLSLIDSGASVSIDARLSARSTTQQPLWPLRLWRLEVCTPYLASGTSKLLDPEWFGGIVTWDRVLRYRHEADKVLPRALVDIAADPVVHVVLAKLVVLLELAIGVGLLWPRTRYFAVWLAVVFHTLIQLSAEIQVFSILGIAGLLIWCVPATRERCLSVRVDTRQGRRLLRLVRLCDWLARFELRLVRGHGEQFVLVERDGRVYTGRACTLHVLSRLPLTAFFALPFVGFDASLPQRGERGQVACPTPCRR